MNIPVVKVIVSGGVVQAVDAPDAVVVIYDYDGDARELPDVDDDGEPCLIQRWGRVYANTPANPTSSIP